MRRDRERFGEVICEARERRKVKAWSMYAKSESSSLEGGQGKEAKWLWSNHYILPSFRKVGGLSNLVFKSQEINLTTLLH